MIKTKRSHHRRGFSLVEMLIALTISATLLTAALAALDTMFKGYKQTTDSASTHVVSRIVMNRVLALVRTGEEFGPFPLNVLDASQNPVVSDSFEAATKRDANGTIIEITRIEFRAPTGAADEGGEGEGEEGEGEGEGEGEIEDVDEDAPTGQLWYVLIDPTGEDEVIIAEFPLLDGVIDADFTLHYDVGPKLMRATIDLLVKPSDEDGATIGGDGTPRTIRLIASASPRQSLAGAR